MATQTQAPPYHEEDVGNLVLLEHVNTQVPDQSLATLFYVVGMGFTRDPEMMVGLDNMWINLGEQQFHLPTGEAQALRGHTGIVTPSLDALAGRLESVAPRLEGTRFAWSRHDGYIEAVSPWGNVFRCYEPAPEFGSMRVGIPYVQFTAPRGSAAGIAAFYEQAIGSSASVRSGGQGDAAEVSVGQHQRLVFQEADDVPEYDGHHIAVYLANFSGPYAFLAERGLITEEPRNHQFRFVDIVDPATNRLLFKIEHEVRGMKHTMFRRPLVNRVAGQFLEPRASAARPSWAPSCNAARPATFTAAAARAAAHNTHGKYERRNVALYASEGRVIVTCVRYEAGKPLPASRPTTERADTLHAPVSTRGVVRTDG